MAYSGGLEHNQIYRPSRAYCAYCRENRPIWKPKHLQPRAFGTNITNISEGSIESRRPIRPRIRGSKTNWGCSQCNIALCKVGDCWHRYRH
jgi:hypothetical protein